jgi:hypothetical protein
VDEFELLFENFAALLNTFTENDDFKTFLLSPEIRLEHRIRRYLLHSNHLIRCSVLRVMKHLFYSHDDENLSKRFCTFKEDEVHVGDV